MTSNKTVIITGASSGMGNLDDIISWVKHLAGQGGRFVTGQTHFVDGGINSGSHST